MGHGITALAGAAAARGIMAMAVDPGAVARGIVAMVVVPGAAAHHGIAAGAVDLTGVVVECRGTAVMVEIATTAVPLTTVAVLLTTVATTVAAAHLITADTRTTVEMYPLLLRHRHRHLKILNTRL